MNYTDATILGGLPVVVSYEWLGAYPSIGESGGVSLGTIYLRKKRKIVPAPEGMLKRMTPKDWNRLYDTCAEHHYTRD